MTTRATVHFVLGFSDERPEVVVEIDGAEKGFTLLGDALEWAESRAERVHVRYGFDGAGDITPDEARERGLVERWDLDQERFTAEFATRHRSPREWYVALEQPDVEGDLADAARKLEQHPDILRVIQAQTQDGLPLLFVDVMARSEKEASGKVSEAVMPVAWPDERMDRTFAPRDTFVVGVAENETVGLVDYRDARFFSAWPPAG